MKAPRDIALSRLGFRLSRRFVRVLIVVACPYAALGCGNQETRPSEAGAPADAETPVFDLCDAFTGADTSCAVPGPLQCFPLCDGGCYCSASAAGPRWICVTDLSCISTCTPLEALDGACVPSEAAATPIGSD
jgi:hypothetical protein